MAKTKSKSRRKLIGWLLGVTVLAGGGAGYYYYRHQQEKPVTVQTEPVARRQITETVVANGRIQPVVQVVMNPEVSGEIIDLPVKEGQIVRKGELLVRIKPDNYIAGTNSAYASYQSSLAGLELAKANLVKADLEFARSDQLFKDKLISDALFIEARTALDVAKAQVSSAGHQAAQARAALAKTLDDLSKTTIYSPITGTVTKLKSQKGERVVGSAMMAGTEIMTLANLEDMEARVDIGEIDVVLIAVGQKARIEVDSFRDRKFTGVVTEIANSSKTAGQISSGSSQEATKFEVKIRVSEKETFRPGMSVTTEIETRYRTNVLAVPIQSVTTRLPKPPKGSGTNAPAASPTNAATGSAAQPPAGGGSNPPAVLATNSATGASPKPSVAAAKPTGSTNAADGLGKANTPTNQAKKSNEPPKPLEVVFVVEGGRAKMVPVKRGISDEGYVEILEGLSEGQAVVSGGYKAINRELEDGKLVQIGPPPGEEKKKED